MRERVLLELSRIESQHDVRILLAVESGSRAWGFASPDSDYDVRFIYAHKRDWYLSVFEERDVVEELLTDQLDISGWDLRKSLRLFSKCNIALNEWLGSPILYSEAPTFRNQLVQLIPDYFNPTAAMHHYRSMSDHALNENLVDGRLRIKSLFYVLRSLLACRWILHTSSQPPTEFERLVAPNWVLPQERDWVEEILLKKGKAAEAEPFDLEQFREEKIREELERHKSAACRLATRPGCGTVNLDKMLREWTSKR